MSRLKRDDNQTSNRNSSNRGIKQLMRRWRRGVRELTKSKAAKHADGSSLVRRGNYTLLRLLIITKAAGPDGITTLALLNELGSKADHINHIINNAKQAISKG